MRLEKASLPAVFHDIAAVIVFLRKVIWTVPDFSVDRYRDQRRLRTGSATQADHGRQRIRSPRASVV